jgi:DnaJ-class molecular chaperone
MSYQIMPSFTSGSTLVFNEDGSGAGAGFWVLSTLHERCDWLYHAGEVLVVLEQEKHPLFERHGSSPDLHYTANISVLDSLVGCSVEVRSLGGEIFKVAVTDIVQ